MKGLKNMNKELEEAINNVKELIEEFYNFPNPKSVSIRDYEVGNIETVLNYIENSIPKEKVENLKKEYKQELEENRIGILMYKNLRKYFNDMVNKILGKDYYNEGMDTYTCDKLTCEDIINKKIKIVLKDKNSIPKEKIEEKIKYKENKLKQLENDRYRKMCLQIEIDILQELLEGK